MLRPADAAVARRDGALPGLSLLLDQERLHTALASVVGEGGLGQPVIEYLRYKPGQSCLAACRIVVHGRAVAFSAKAYRADASHKLRKPFEKSATPTLLGPGPFLLDRGVVVLPFPNDRKLTTLASMDPRRLHARLLRHRVADGGAPDRFAEIQPLRYNPERRFVGRLVAHKETVAAVRCYTRADFERAAAKSGALASRGSLRLARVLGRVARSRLLVMEWLQGELLHDAIRQGTASADTLRAVGMALAELHMQEAPALPGQSARSDPSTLRALAHDLGSLCPDLGKQARSLAERLAGRLGGAAKAQRPIHGDFHTQQVLLQDGAVAVLDLDEAAWGEPGLDLGRFGADLERSVIGGALDGDQAHAMMDALLEGYSSAAGAVPSHLTLHVATHLLRIAPHPFRRREPDWTEMTAAILDRAQAFLEADVRNAHPRISVSAATAGAVLGGCASGRRSRTRAEPPAVVSPGSEAVVVDPFGVLLDTQMPFVAEALNPAAMTEHFTRALRCLSGSERAVVGRIAVMRHKPGRRCVIQYLVDVCGSSGAPRQMMLIGKCRTRGVDTSTHRLVTDLWTGPFGPEAADDVFVPEPVCVLPAVHMTVQRQVPGVPLWSLLAGSNGIPIARRAAEAIAKLHRVSIAPRRRHSADDELSMLRQRLAAVADAHPVWRERIEGIVEGCARIAARLDPPLTCGIHRDFYPDQLLSDGGRLWLVDLDLHSEGDPALDAGNFAAHLDEYAVRRFGNADHWAGRTRAFIDRFIELSGGSTRERIDVYAMLSLARLVAIGVQFAERQPFTEALLDLCEERLSGKRWQGAEST